ncbi:hypothetical protein BD779DRAFT_1013066 [Infundibulicybe gibba]|nr:hypothetical protein BD779DRAFT_1013066 [Infundibulicybe gibba]
MIVWEAGGRRCSGHAALRSEAETPWLTTRRFVCRLLQTHTGHTADAYQVTIRRSPRHTVEHLTSHPGSLISPSADVPKPRPRAPGLHRISAPTTWDPSSLSYERASARYCNTWQIQGQEIFTTGMVLGSARPRVNNARSKSWNTVGDSPHTVKREKAAPRSRYLRARHNIFELVNNVSIIMYNYVQVENFIKIL